MTNHTTDSREEKLYTLNDLVRMHPAWSEYVSEVITSNRASVLAGFPAREWTEVRTTAEGEIIVRYKRLTKQPHA